MNHELTSGLLLLIMTAFISFCAGVRYGKFVYRNLRYCYLKTIRFYKGRHKSTKPGLRK